MASLVGQTLGQYQLVAQLGYGGMATVYRAYHERLDRTVAVKMVHPMFMDDQSFLARFAREAQIVARLEHAHIVPVYDFNEYNGQPYLVMKFIDGKTLKALSTEKPLALNEILRIMPPVADALDYAHGQGILHRDIKPSNIMMDSAGVPYLTDFGLARMTKTGESTLSHDILLGTPNYISPEQGQGKGALTPRTDQYSLGVVLYELIVGQVPFSADTPFAVVHSHIYVPPPVPSSVNPSISPAVDAVLMRALAKNPEERYPNAKDMIAAFREAVQESDMHSLNVVRRASTRTPSSGQSASAAVDLPNAVYNADENAPTLHTPPPTSDDAQVIAGQAAAASSPTSDKLPTDSTPSSGKRVVEMSFDLGNVAQSMKQAGDQVKTAVEQFAASQGKHVEFGDKAKRGLPAAQPSTPKPVEETFREAGEAVRGAFEGMFGVTDLDIASEDDQSATRKRIEKQVKKRQELFGHAVTYIVINGLLWFIYLSGSAGQIPFLNDVPPDAWAFPWPFIVSMGWGAGLVAHVIDTSFETGKRAARRLRIVRDAYRREFGANWSVAPKSELKRIRKDAEKPFKKRQEFFTHLGVYTMINIMLWSIFLFANSELMSVIADGDTEFMQAMDFPWPIFVTLGWGIGLVWNALEAMTAGSQERAIEREMERERQILASEKPKRDARRNARRQLPGEDEDVGDFDMIDEPIREREARSERRAERGGIRLTEDGELTESMIIEIEDENERQRRTRR